MLARSHLIYFRKNVRVVYLEETKNSGNKNIRKYHVEGYSTIPFHWEFAAKIYKGGAEEDVVPC
jgi:hypothetical protein